MPATGLVTMLLAAPAAVQPSPCPLPLAAPAPFVGWTAPVPLVAAEAPDAPRAPALQIGRATVVTLAPRQAVGFAVAPAKPGAPASYAGQAFVTVIVPGTYRIGLGASASVDVVQRGQALPSIAHAHGDPCSAVVKTVDYRLAAGRYAVQLSAAAAPVLTVMVTRLP